MDFSWRGSGLISGNKLAQMLQTELGDTQIEDLDRPFICIGTELSTGHEIWLQKEGTWSAPCGRLMHCLVCSSPSTSMTCG